MKRIIALCLTIIVLASVFCGCADNTKDNGKIKVVATVFPVYDWAKNIIGGDDDIDLTLLLDSGVDMHSFQPSAQDIVKISSCDMFIYVGGESDEWVTDALDEKTNKNMIVVNLMDLLKDRIKEEEIAEGMEGEVDGAYDEHVWLSLKNAERACKYIDQKLETLDPKHKNTYSHNAQSYVNKLKKLDEEYTQTVAAAKNKTLIFGDRFPFRYLTEDYGIEYYAAFAGCSAETEASFKTIAFLSKKIDKLGAKYILKIDNSDGKVAETIIKNTRTKDQKILTLDSMQSTTPEQISKGASYLSVTEKNLKILKQIFKE